MSAVPVTTGLACEPGLITAGTGRGMLRTVREGFTTALQGVVAPAPQLAPPSALDAESAVWLASLGSSGAERERAVGQLHAMLLRVSRSEARRRGPRFGLAGPELDDVAHQAAADAVLAVTAKLGQFQGRSRFTTWAYRFAVLEVASKLGRHWSRQHPDRLDDEDWNRLPDRFGIDPGEHAEGRDLAAAVRDAVDSVLTARQRTVFVALIVHQVPLDALVAQTGSTRGALYKTMFDARRKIRGHLDANGYLTTPPAARRCD